MTQADLDRNEIIDKDEVLKMAREAGFEDLDNWTLTSMPWLCSRLEAFAKLVHQRGFMDGYTSCDKDNQNMLSYRIDDAVEEEREACAKICENFDPQVFSVAAAIRARGETTSRGEV